MDWGDVLAVIGVVLLGWAAWLAGGMTALIAFGGALLVTVAVVRMIVLRQRGES